MKTLTQEEADKYKRIHWAHKPDLEWIFPNVDTLLIDAINYRYEVLRDGDKYDLCHFKPILRHLDDLTDEEIKKSGALLFDYADNQRVRCFYLKTRCAAGESSHIVDAGELMQSRKNALRILKNSLPESVVLNNFLLEIGVDIYGLIETGHAVRKGVEG